MLKTKHRKYCLNLKHSTVKSKLLLITVNTTYITYYASRPELIKL